MYRSGIFQKTTENYSELRGYSIILSNARRPCASSITPFHLQRASLRVQFTPHACLTLSLDRSLYNAVIHTSFPYPCSPSWLPIFFFFVVASCDSRWVRCIITDHVIVSSAVSFMATSGIKRAVVAHIPRVGIVLLSGLYPRWLKCFQPLCVSLESRGHLWFSASFESVDVDPISLFHTASCQRWLFYIHSHLWLDLALISVSHSTSLVSSFICASFWLSFHCRAIVGLLTSQFWVNSVSIDHIFLFLRRSSYTSRIITW